MHRTIRSLALAAALALAFAPATALADPVVISAASVQFTPPPGWDGRSLGPQVAQFRRGDAVTVDVTMPALDAQHTEASLLAEFTRGMRPRWRGRPALRVVREQRGTMRRGTASHNGQPGRVIVVSVPMGARLLLAAIYLGPSATPDEEGASHQLIDSLRPAP